MTHEEKINMKGKYYFFRDLNHEDSLWEGKTFHAAGYVVKVSCEDAVPNENGKDLAVKFIDPFNGGVDYVWRALNEVELFEVSKEAYYDLVDLYDKIHCL